MEQLPEQLPVYPEVYMTDLDNAVNEIKHDIFSSLTSEQYISELRSRFSVTEEYEQFHITLHGLGSRLIKDICANPTDDSKELMNFFMHNVPLRDGFIFGLAVNDHLLAKKSADPEKRALDSTGNHAAILIRDISKESSTTLDASIRFNNVSNQLYDSSIAHPKESGAEWANHIDDPVKKWVDVLSNDLYKNWDNPDDQQSQDALIVDTDNFKRGYGLARYSYNTYRKYLTDELNETYYDTQTPPKI